MGVPQIRCLVGDLEVILGLAALMKIDQMNMAAITSKAGAWPSSMAALCGPAEAAEVLNYQKQAAIAPCKLHPTRFFGRASRAAPARDPHRCTEAAGSPGENV